MVPNLFKIYGMKLIKQGMLFLLGIVTLAILVNVIIFQMNRKDRRTKFQMEIRQMCDGLDVDNWGAPKEVCILASYTFADWIMYGAAHDPGTAQARGGGLNPKPSYPNIVHPCRWGGVPRFCLEQSTFDFLFVYNLDGSLPNENPAFRTEDIDRLAQEGTLTVY